MAQVSPHSAVACSNFVYAVRETNWKVDLVSPPQSGMQCIWHSFRKCSPDYKVKTAAIYNSTTSPPPTYTHSHHFSRSQSGMYYIGHSPRKCSPSNEEFDLADTHESLNRPKALGEKSGSKALESPDDASRAFVGGGGVLAANAC